MPTIKEQNGLCIPAVSGADQGFLERGFIYIMVCVCVCVWVRFANFISFVWLNNILLYFISTFILQSICAAAGLNIVCNDHFNPTRVSVFSCSMLAISISQ